MTDHESLGELSGAYVLGALEPDERAEFERHLGGCSECQASVADFAPIPGLLVRVDTFEPGPPPVHVLEEVKERVASERHALVVSRRRWRVATVAAALALVLVVLQGTALQDVDTGPVAVAFDVEPDWGVEGQVTLSERGWGTEVGFDLTALPPDVTCVAWTVGSNGEWQQVAWWGPTESHRARVTGASSLQFEEVAAVVVTTTDRNQIVTRASVESSR